MKIDGRIRRQGWFRLGGVLILAMALASVQAPAQQLATPLATAGESVIAPELAQAHPAIAQYHWSKLPNHAGKPKYGGTLHLDLRNEPTNWDPFTGNTGTLGWGSVVYNKLMQVDMTLTTAFEMQGANLQQLFPICDLCETWQQTSPTQYTFKIRPEARWQNVPPLNGRRLTAQDVRFAYDKYCDPKAFQQWATFQMVESIEAPFESTGRHVLFMAGSSDQVSVSTRRPGHTGHRAVACPVFRCAIERDNFL